MGGAHFCLLDTNGFHGKAKSERFPAARSRCCQNPKPHKMHQKACRTCSTIIFPLLTNQIISLWRWRCSCRPSFLRLLNDNIFSTLQPWAWCELIIFVSLACLFVNIKGLVCEETVVHRRGKEEHESRKSEGLTLELSSLLSSLRW